MGKGGDSAPKTDKPHELLIRGRLYDVSNFTHPGGSIIKFLTDGGDATEAFVEFHGRLKKAELILKSIPSRPAPASVMKTRGYNGKEALSKDYLALREELEKEGYFDPAPSHVAYRVAEIVAMHALGAYLFMAFDSLVVKALGVFVLGVVSGRCGWLMHEGGHYSLTGVPAVDRALQIALYGIGCGMSAAWWRNQHNKHHATPQKLKHDVDLDTLPLVAFNAAIAQKAKNPVLKWWLRNQALLFTPVSCLIVALGWQYYLHPRHIVRTKRLHTEGLMLVLRHLLLYGVVFKGFSFGSAFGLFLIYNCIASSYIFSQFAMSHTHLPVSKPDEFLHWAEYGSNHTTNIKNNFMVNWFMGYLNFQIEHHLFPSMPQFRHPIVSPRVKALFLKHGLTYDERPYFSCLMDTWRNLHEVGQSVDEKKKA
uniref:Cytochrome b5 heme-binding domain-containing protein n=1 Tax=Rhizochromulina marina TaxID=1034831 RepID=A0A7S2RAP0_9STRA|mmetsp:Transcript_13039/g.37909  ORF Transcript_13039/g.37909 Transcript_13039/m.37909 type:complete len:423 (+) Transcript_13039:38-1306(+)